MSYDDTYERIYLKNKKYNKKSKKLQNIYKEKDILSVFECARTLNTTKENIISKILLGEIIHIGNLRGELYPLVFKRDLLNYSEEVLDCTITSYKKYYTDILSNYPDNLCDIHLMSILDFPNVTLAYYFIKENPELDYYSTYNPRIQKIEINKYIFINFLISHRRKGYINNNSNYHNIYQYPNMCELYCNGTLFPIEYKNNNEIQNENLSKGYKVIRPFKFIDSKVDFDKYYY